MVAREVGGLTRESQPQRAEVNSTRARLFGTNTDGGSCTKHNRRFGDYDVPLDRARGVMTSIRAAVVSDVDSTIGNRRRCRGKSIACGRRWCQRSTGLVMVAVNWLLRKERCPDPFCSLCYRGMTGVLGHLPRGTFGHQGNQLLTVEWLGHMVIAAGIEALVPISAHGVGRQCDDRARVPHFA